MIRLIEEIIVLALIFWLEGFFPLFLGRTKRSRIGHAIPNISIALINGLVVSVLFSGLTVQAIHWSEANSFGIIRWLNLGPQAGFIAGFLLFDCWMYFWHMANHLIPVLWRFHRMHHSDLELDSTSGIRFHTGEIIISSLLRLAIIPLIGLSWTTLLIYEICLQPIVLFHHSNIALPEKYDRILRCLIVTPNMHRVHHSQLAHEYNSNFSSGFSFWDRMVRTFRKREDTRMLQYGLPNFQEPAWQKLAGMLKTPFVNFKK